jgi:hypothetical protein
MKPAKAFAAMRLFTAFSIGSEGFVFRMEVMTPNDTRQSLRLKDFPVILAIKLDAVPAVDLGVLTR